MIKICSVCKKEFKTSPSQNYKTCSLKCRNKSPWKKKVSLAVSKIDKNDYKNPRWKGGKSRGYILKKAMESWKKKKLPYKCESCGAVKKKMNYHHRDKNQKNNLPSNIMFVCYSCHNKIHEKGSKEKCKKCGQFLGKRKHKCN